MPRLKKLLPFLVFLSVFIGIIYYIPPPSSWSEASIFQILIFFIPLLFLLTFFINIFTGYSARSFAISLGIIVLLVLKSVDELNLTTFFLTLVTTILLSTTFKKPTLKERRPLFRKNGLTSKLRIPKLTKFEGRRKK